MVKHKNKTVEAKAVEYARLLAEKKGTFIPKEAFGHVEWGRVGKAEKAKSVIFETPIPVKIDIPNWDFVPKATQRQLF